MTVQPKCEVRRYSPSGEELFRLQLVTPPDGCLAANGVAVDARGTLFAAVFSSKPATRGAHVVDTRGVVRRIPGSEQIVTRTPLR